MFSQKDREVLKNAVLEAGRMALEIAANPYPIEEKAGGLGPVTAADKALNEFLVSRIHKLFPSDVIVAEESASAVGAETASRAWFIDPIDGTKDFIRGSAEWSVLVGVAQSGKPIAGWVYQPKIDRLWYGIKNEGAYFEEKGLPPQRMQCQVITDLSKATAVTSRSHPESRANRTVRDMGIPKTYQHGSVGLKMCEIALNNANVYFNYSGKCNLWDTCAGEAILSEAGGRVSYLSGEPIHYSPHLPQVMSPFMAVNENLFEKVKDFFHGKKI